MERGFKSWCENIAAIQRKILGLKQLDPLDPWKLAKHMNTIVWKADEVPDIDKHSLKILEDDKDSWSAVTLNVGEAKLVILNPSHSQLRLNSDLMHELAHIIIGHTAHRMDFFDDDLSILNTHNKDQEDEAQWLAGCLLLPRIVVEDLVRNGFTIDEVKLKYGVSEDMYKYRKSITGVSKQYYRNPRKRVQ
jgi:Zn-dependent peptidase ImmA (M78 family)